VIGKDLKKKIRKKCIICIREWWLGHSFFKIMVPNLLSLCKRSPKALLQRQFKNQFGKKKLKENMYIKVL
jgi:hypothetical protein